MRVDPAKAPCHLPGDKETEILWSLDTRARTGLRTRVKREGWIVLSLVVIGAAVAVEQGGVNLLHSFLTDIVLCLSVSAALLLLLKCFTGIGFFNVSAKDKCMVSRDEIIRVITFPYTHKEIRMSMPISQIQEISIVSLSDGGKLLTFKSPRAALNFPVLQPAELDKLMRVLPDGLKGMS